MHGKHLRYLSEGAHTVCPSNGDGVEVPRPKKHKQLKRVQKQVYVLPADLERAETSRKRRLEELTQHGINNWTIAQELNALIVEALNAQEVE